MKRLLFFLTILLGYHIHAQELFTYTEPASNMASKSMAIRLNNRFFYHPNNTHSQYQLAPECMVAFSKLIMIHGETFFSNAAEKIQYNGFSLYAKWRIYSVDEVHSHFRIGMYGRYSNVNLPIQQQAIDLNGFNSGMEGGIVATTLNQRTALSANVSMTHALDNGSEKIYAADNHHRNAINTSLSVGRLMLPREYRSFDQTNLNLMLELLSQVNMGDGRAYVDAGPVLQLIMKSRIRIDFSYRFPLMQSLNRAMSNSLLFRVDYNFFNVW